MKTQKEMNFQDKLDRFNTSAKMTRKYTLREKVLCFLAEHPNEWFYVWEVERKQCSLGWTSHKSDNELSKLATEGLIDTAKIGKFSVYSMK